MEEKEAFEDVVVTTSSALAVTTLAELPEIKLFGRWNCDDVQVNDMSLQDYIAVKEKNAKYLPHSAGRYAAKRFRKAQCPIVERLTNSLMMHGRNNGKKLMAVRIVKHAFEIIHLLTGENPLQVSCFQFWFFVHISVCQHLLIIKFSNPVCFVIGPVYCTRFSDGSKQCYYVLHEHFNVYNKFYYWGNY